MRNTLAKGNTNQTPNINLDLFGFNVKIEDNAIKGGLYLAGAITCTILAYRCFSKV